MFWRIEVREKDGFYDALGQGVKRDIEDLGFKGKVKEVKAVQVYFLEGELEEHHIKKICENLLIDPVTQDYSYNGNIFNEEKYKVVEIAYNPGVMDPVEDSTKKAIGDLGIRGIKKVKTSRKYLILGNLSHKNIHSIAIKGLKKNRVINFSYDFVFISFTYTHKKRR